MSADNWRVCPKCTVIAETAYADSQKKIAISYGKISAEEYLKLVNAAPKLPEPHETLREDYEIGTYKDGEFSVDYSCACTKCGLSFSFKHKQKI